MIDPVNALHAVRRELRETVAPALPDGLVKEQLIAAIGILGEVARRVREDETFYRVAAEALRADLAAVCARLPAQVVPGPEADQEAEADRAADPRAERIRLLGLAEDLFDLVWSRPGEPWAVHARERLRAALAADLSRQLTRGRTPRGETAGGHCATATEAKG